jgi:hypothetical protein
MLRTRSTPAALGDIACLVGFRRGVALKNVVEIRPDLRRYGDAHSSPFGEKPNGDLVGIALSSATQIVICADDDVRSFGWER